MELKQGIVQIVSQKKTTKGLDKYGLQIEGIWYNGFGISPAGKGDAVTISYLIDPAYGNQVKKVDITTKGTAVTRDERVKAQDDRLLGMLISYVKDTRIQVMEIFKGKPIKPEEVEMIAREIVFRDYRAVSLFLKNAEKQTEHDDFVTGEKLQIETIKI